MRTTPTGAIEALLCLLPLELVVLGDARSAAHRLWSLGCWLYLHPNRGHSSVLTRLQQSDPNFSMRVDAMRPTFNFEPRYTIPHIAQGGLDWGPGCSSWSQRARLVYGRVQDEGGDWGWSLWAIRKKKAQLLPGQICKSLPGRDLYYLGLCL
jgi:hypothetical protein